MLFSYLIKILPFTLFNESHSFYQQTYLSKHPQLIKEILF